ncbi:RNA polymerase sigma factor RpoE [Catenovulum maritimum]|jgi:RNA polymerase sigma-70 factor (ECF subfamily)|uniref:RNA polymerase sigma factor RpoE n=1 Tax=Catenovulum maritimum TaxID=1513271 RepID=A0A0J8GN74_9ALTE|nr:RNA polymerase sigma factor RpoE [Catenovulum maritimum]KMT64292.1 RNA polymerase sigma factor RpoE [Catenovulum maritimum]
MSLDVTDQQLVERVQRGEKQAFNLLVLKYQHKVTNLVARYVKHPGDVADVAQEAFIKAYRAMPGFRGESAFYTWLYRIAVNSAKNYLTSQARKVAVNDIEVSDAEFFDSADGLRENSSPENLLISEDVKKVIFATIDQLPNDLKTAITLREIDGMSYEEIADIMECPVGTVRSRIFRAREAIDTNLKPMLAKS